MTDNEIIKALECCINDKCQECPLNKLFCGREVAMQYALDLINRQKAEIERLRQNLKEAHIDIKEKQAEIEEYKEANKRWSAALNNANEENSELQLKIVSCNSEIEKLNNTIKIQGLEICNLTKQSIVCDAGFLQELEIAKAEAIKEFAERLKKIFSWQYTTALWKPLCEFIDNLVKEMVGDNE